MKTSWSFQGMKRSGKINFPGLNSVVLGMPRNRHLGEQVACCLIFIEVVHSQRSFCRKPGNRIV